MKSGWMRKAHPAVWVLLAAWNLSPALAATPLEQARQMLDSGDYTGCAALARKEIPKSTEESWHLLLGRALLESGKYPEALTAITNALNEHRWSIQVRWLAREVFQVNGHTGPVNEMVESIIRYVSMRPRDYRDAPSLVVFGRAALLRGADPKRVLDTVFDTAKKTDPKLKELYVGIGQLALDKHDYALAAKTFEEGLKQLPDDPELHFGCAQAYAGSDPDLAKASADSALKRNPNHVGTLLLLTDHSIDAEDFTQADSLLDRIQRINPAHPDAWAYRAVLRHLRNRPKEEAEARQSGLKFWPANPRVDHLIGLKLSQNYRFAEGAARQRKALELDASYLPAKAQLAQDLLRLGEEVEGWQLANEVQRLDPYDVEAYNLATLHDTLGKFTTLTNSGFVIRMHSREAAIYGPRVLDLLSRAKKTLCAKYGLELTRPTLVEIFHDQKDFAVRTFGLPGNPGYLGVCFGNVITANSPAANPAHPINWEAVLWHEFCHVVTLHLTRNKMPRWLSEGISVYEELQANPAWGQRMLPRYREMILEGELTPVSKLSGAFLAPESDVHLQFAYYQSCLVVEYLVTRFGADKLQAILKELGEGAEINQAIAKHTISMAEIDKEFGKFAVSRAKELAPGLDWEKPGFAQRGERRAVPGARERDERNRVLEELQAGAPTLDAEAEWRDWARNRPTNFWVMVRQADELIEAKDWKAAKAPLLKLIELYPDYVGEDSAYRKLAAVHRALGETDLERETLAAFAARDDEAVDAYSRLADLCAASHEWSAVALNAQRALAVNPLVPHPYRHLARAAEAQRDWNTGIGAWRTILRLEPPDPADAHFQLARMLRQVGEPEAKRQLLNALEEAPRHEAALALLLEMDSAPAKDTRGAGAGAGNSTP